jgi:hypothetical protein
MRHVFEAADVDASGDLSHEEVKDLLAERGLNCTDGYVEGVFESYDTDSSGTIDYSEFEQLSKLVQRRLENGGGYSKPATQSVISTQRRSQTPPRSVRPARRAVMAAATFGGALREPPALPAPAQSIARLAQNSPEPLRDPPGLPESESVATLAKRTETEQLAASARSQRDFAERKAAQLKEDAHHRP